MDSIQRINIGEVVKEKEIPKPRSFVKEKKDKREIPAPEFDLHIEKLVPNKRGMSNYDILTLQTETAKRHIEFAIKNCIPKIVFIHGVGEGILKSELDFLLGRYDNIAFQDGNYQKYGQGSNPSLFQTTCYVNFVLIFETQKKKSNFYVVFRENLLKNWTFFSAVKHFFHTLISLFLRLISHSLKTHFLSF